MLHQRNLALCLGWLGSLERLGVRHERADGLFAEDRTIRHRLSALDPKHDRRRMELMLGPAHYGRHAEAAEIAASIEANTRLAPETRLEVVRTYALASASAAYEPGIARE